MMTDAPETSGRPVVVVVTEDEALLRMLAVEASERSGFCDD